LAERIPSRAGEPATVVQRAYHLALWLIRKTEKFPRSFRFSVGGRVVERALDVLESLAAAAYSTAHRAATGGLECACRHGDTWKLREQVFSQYPFSAVPKKCKLHFTPRQ